MEHLRAELEIRGLERCAEELPEVSKKCYEKIKEVVEACSKGDCFVDPEKVIEEAREVKLKRSNKLVYALTVVSALEAILIVIMILKLFELEHKVTTMEDQIMRLATITSRKFEVMGDILDSIQLQLSKVSTMKDTLEALKYAVYLLGK